MLESRVAALDANSTSVIPQGLDEQLANVMKNGTSVKDQLSAKAKLSWTKIKKSNNLIRKDTEVYYGRHKLDRKYNLFPEH